MLIKNLLYQVSIIQKKYDDLAEYSGEHYNVFDILGVTTDELSHSAILTNLLNAKGKHGQKELFLELFLKEIKQKFGNSDKKIVLENFNIKNSFAVKEKYTGRVDYEADQGGRIDIIINDGKNNIIIENKIYAGDQPKQLVRYNEHDKNAPILYLTLEGKEPSDNSIGNLVLNKDFICISYTTDIKVWLENCIKEMANKPIIRETLNQYLFLIKSLTNQSNNNKMGDEIVKIILKDEDSFETAKQINKSLNYIDQQLNTRLDDIVEIGLKEVENIRKTITSNAVFENFKILPKFPHNGKKLIRFDLVISELNNQYECIMIELMVEDYKLYGSIHSNNKIKDVFLRQKMEDKLEFYFDFYVSKFEIFEDIKTRIDYICKIFENN